MANLYTGNVVSNGEYVDISEASGIVFEIGKDYQIQFFNKGYIREGETGEGFCIYKSDPFTLRYTGGTVYVCGETKIGINIAD